MLALALFGVLVTYPAHATHRLATVVVGVAIAAWIVLFFSVVSRWPFGIAWAVFGFGAEYALFLRLRAGTVDTRAIFVAGALVLTTELAFTAIVPSRGARDRAVVIRTLFTFVAAVLSAMTVAGVVLVAAGSVRSGLAFEAFGVLAAALALSALLRIAARTKSSRTS